MKGVESQPSCAAIYKPGVELSYPLLSGGRTSPIVVEAIFVSHLLFLGIPFYTVSLWFFQMNFQFIFCIL